MHIQGEDCQWQFARQPTLENYVFKDVAAGLQNAGRIPYPQPYKIAQALVWAILYFRDRWGFERDCMSAIPDPCPRKTKGLWGRIATAFAVGRGESLTPSQ